MQKTIALITGIFLIGLTLAFLPAGNLFFNETASCYTLLFVGAVLICKLIHEIFRKNPNKKFQATAIDLAFFLFMGWIILHTLLLNRVAVDPFLWHKLGAVAGFYLLVRLTGQKEFLLYALVLSGVIQAVIAVGQSRGMLSGYHLIFDITGTLGNPGQLGGYLAVCLAVTLCLLWIEFKKQRTVLSVLLLLAGVLQGTGLFLSDSRAGWVGLLAGLLTGVFMARRHESAKARNKEAAKSKSKFSLSCLRAFVLLSFFTLVTVLLYTYRPKSADARLLIWRVSCDMVADRPLTGHGAGAFDSQYLLYQAAFFEQHPESPLALVAGNAGYPFNELLHALVSFGFIGLALLLFLARAVFFNGAKVRKHEGTKTGSRQVPILAFVPSRLRAVFQSGLAAWIAFSMFSYPTDVFPLLLLGVTCLAGIEARRYNSSRLCAFAFFALRCMRLRPFVFNAKNAKARRRNVFSGVFIVFISVILFNVWQDTGELKRLSQELAKPFLNLDEVESSYEKMKANPTFNNSCMPWIESLPAERRVQRACELFPSCEACCLKGRAWLNVGDTIQAERAFYTASNMVPALIRPKYALWQLYAEKGDTAAARKTAQAILNSPVKTESIYTLRVKREMRDFMMRLPPEDKKDE